MNTHAKGQIAELKVQQKAVEKGFLVSKPIYDGGRYDLVIDDGKTLKKAQVKYADADANHCDGAIQLGLVRRGNSYSPNEVDLLLVYIPKKDIVLCFPPEKFHGKAGIQIRLELPKNNQKTGINFYEDFVW